MTDISFEMDRRGKMWRDIAQETLNDVDPQRLLKAGIYGRAQGIRVDKERTAGPVIGIDGATVAILHTEHNVRVFFDFGVCKDFARCVSVCT